MAETGSEKGRQEVWKLEKNENNHVKEKYKYRERKRRKANVMVFSQSNS